MKPCSGVTFPAGEPCPNHAKPQGKYCSDACRARSWRMAHIPRCPHCGGTLELAVARSNGPQGSCT